MTALTVHEASPSTALAPAADMSLGVFSSSTSFEAGQRMARALATSDIVPAAYKGNMANCVVALDMALRMKLSPLVVLQNLNVIHGRPSWSSTFIISAINSSGLFSPLRFEFRGAEGSDDWACRALATELSSRASCEGPWISIGMAKREGWYARQGSKWPNMSEVMLRYRAAAFFGRMYAAHLLAGMPSVEEVEDTTAQVRPALVTVTAAAATPAEGSAADRVTRRGRRPRDADPGAVDVMPTPAAPAPAVEAPEQPPAAEPAPTPAPAPAAEDGTDPLFG